MNELECIIDEVHRHVLKNEYLSSDITFTPFTEQYKILIVYGNFSIILGQYTFELCYATYHQYENYVPDKDLHFNAMISDDVLCDYHCIQKMIDIRNYYGIPTECSERFQSAEDYNIAE